MKELSCCPSCQTLPASQVTLLCFFSPSSVETRVLTPQLSLAKTFPFLSLQSPSCHIPLPLDFLRGYRSSPQAQHALRCKVLQGHQHCKAAERWDDLHYAVLLIRHSKRNMYPGVLCLLYRLPEASEVTCNEKQVPFAF